MIENPDINESTQTSTETEPTWLDDEELKAQHKKHQVEIKEQKRKQEEEATKLKNNQLNEEPKQQVQDKVNQTLEKWNKKTEKDERKYVENMIINDDIEWILKYIWFNNKWIINQTLPLKTKDFLNYNIKKEIDTLEPIKDISKNSIFQANNNETWIIKETKEEYSRIHKKLTSIKKWKDTTIDKKLLHSINKLFKELKLLEKNNFIGKLYKKLKYGQIINDIILVKKGITEQDMKENLKKVEKHIKRIKQYEHWEYINFPNWINYELRKWPESEKWNIKIWENEYYIRTHIETDRENKRTRYIEYVESLKKAREFFKKNNINIKYCRRCTWLANRQFIETYEEKRKIRKWKDYTKSNRLKVLEQTEKAVVFEEMQKGSKPPIRFIDESKDRELLEFIKGEGKELFHESIMWLDLDKL